MAIDSNWLAKDFYAALDLDSTATTREIKTNYRKLAQKYHPDKTKGDKDAEAKFKEVSEAYEVLSNDAKRKDYDQVRALSNVNPYSGFQFNGDVPMDSLFKDLLNDMNAPTSGFGFSSPNATSKKRAGRTYKADANIAFEDAIKGVTVKFATPEGKEITAAIPELVEEDEVITYHGQGDPGLNGGPNGDLIVTIKIKPHKWFTRQNADLTIVMPVTIDELALGAVIEVPTLDETVKVRIASGTSVDTKLKVKGKGAKKKDGSFGDLYVAFKVEIPKTLPPAAIEALEKYRQATEIHQPRAKFYS